MKNYVFETYMKISICKLPMWIPKSFPRLVFLKISEIKVSSFIHATVRDETWQEAWDNNWTYEISRKKEWLFGPRGRGEMEEESGE